MIRFCPKGPRGLGSVALCTGLLLAATAATAQSLPDFDKRFSPASIGPGSIATLTFTITNDTSSPVTELSFTDSFPGGMTVADPPTGVDTCQGTLTAAEGDATIAYSDGAVPGDGACTIEVNVTSSTAGTHENVTGNLTSSVGNSGSASATLTVSSEVPGFTKRFAPNPAVFDGRVRLTLTVDNSASNTDRANLTLTDTLPAGLSVASPSNLSNDCGGSATASGDTIGLGISGTEGPATVAAGATCSVAVDLVAGAVGRLGNLAGTLTSTPAPFGSTESSGKAGDSLEVLAERLALTKRFVGDPVAPGETVDLRFELTNLSRRSPVTDIGISDDLDATLAGLAATSLPAEPCGAGSTISGSGLLSLAGGNLPAEGSCSFTVTLQVPATASPGGHINTTSSPQGTSGDTTVSGAPASDTLFIEPAGVGVSKTFLDNPVGAGGATTLELTLTNSGASPASDISFTDELPIVLPTASSVPASGFCNGTGSATFTPLRDPPSSSAIPATLTITDAALGAGESCTFSVTLDVAQSASPGFHTNATSEVTATIDDVTATGDPATDELQVIAGPTLSKAFTDDPAVPGSTATMELTLTQAPGESSGTASNIAFSDDLSGVISGLSATGLPANDVCGTGSVLSGTTTLTLSGGTLGAGESCTFGVSLAVPADAPPGLHRNQTSSVTADVEGVSTVTPAASADLLVAGVSLSKTFVDDPVPAGGTVTLRFTIDNVGSSNATKLSFLDDLDNAVPNMTAAGLPLNDVCGSGSSLSSLSGGTVLSFEGGSLAAGTSCTFDVTLNVPETTLDGTYNNATSGFSGTIDGASVTLADAGAELEVLSELLALSKSFVDDPVAPGDMVTLRFTVDNLGSQALSSIAFTDDLDAALSDLASVSGTLTDPCGTGSTLSGSGVLSLSGGNLAGMASCSFDVAVAVPATATGEDSIVNVTSEITGSLNGVAVTGSPARDELRLALLSLGKAFDRATADPGETVTLSFTIANEGADTASELAFIDDLATAIPGLEAAGLPLTEVCGPGSSIDGTSTLTFAGGTLPPDGSCTFSVDVTIPDAATPGEKVNVTGALRQTGVPVAEPATASIEINEVTDSDADGVLDSEDICPDTVIPEGVPTVELKPIHYALVDDDFTFDTRPPPGGGNGPGDVFTTADTGGCSCEQIIDGLDLGEGHVKFGCSIGAMRNWVSPVSFGPTLDASSFEPAENFSWPLSD